MTLQNNTITVIGDTKYYTKRVIVVKIKCKMLVFYFFYCMPYSHLYTVQASLVFNTSPHFHVSYMHVLFIRTLIKIKT